MINGHWQINMPVPVFFLWVLGRVSFARCLIKSFTDENPLLDNV